MGFRGFIFAVLVFANGGYNGGDSVAISNEVDQEWELVTKTDNWQVYSRKVKDQPVKQVKVIGELKANFNSVKEAMSDIESYPDWVYSCIDSYKIDEINLNEFHSYTKTNLPFPLKDRDLVVYTKMKIMGDQEWHSTSDARPVKIPEDDSAVRIKNYHAEWKMVPKTDKSIQFEYKLAMEPGGILPAWVVNLAITKIPINTISALENRSIEIMNNNVSSIKK